MATKKKVTKKEETPVEETPVIEEKAPVVEEKVEKTETKTEKAPKKEVKTLKYPIGSIVYVAKDVKTDLEGFCLFPQYKKYTYTVEAYNDDTGVYSLRRLNLSLKLKEADIINPDERAHDMINRKQF